MSSFTESVVEDAALAWLEALGYAVLHGPDISPGGNTLTPAPLRAPRPALQSWPVPAARSMLRETPPAPQWEREKCSDVVLEQAVLLSQDWAFA